MKRIERHRAIVPVFAILLSKLLKWLRMLLLRYWKDGKITNAVNNKPLFGATRPNVIFVFSPRRPCWPWQQSQLLRSYWWWHGCSYRILGQFSQNLELIWQATHTDTHTFSTEIWRDQCCSLLLWNNISTLYLQVKFFYSLIYCINRLSVNEIYINIYIKSSEVVGGRNWWLGVGNRT